MFRFTLEKTSSRARAGIIETDHGQILTPVFMPVGTLGTVKAMSPHELKESHAQIILGNTYHLYLRPGHELIRSAGGLHKFISWDRPMLTDSGGFQVMSLSDLRKITREGVQFQSHIDGSRHFFTPESVIAIQEALGADIIMSFDECPPYPATREYVEKSLKTTLKWAERGKLAFTNSARQALFGIVQGGIYEDLRERSALELMQMDFPGYSIGGLAVGEPKEDMFRITAFLNDILPKDKPRYLMGVGTPWNILECIGMGVDMFDCVMPTRNGRNAMLFTTNGVINIDNKKWEYDFSPIDEGLPCETSNFYSKAYLRHLMKAKEILGLTIASVHNLAFYLWLVGEARNHILAGDFHEWKTGMVQRLKQKL